MRFKMKAAVMSICQQRIRLPTITFNYLIFLTFETFVLNNVGYIDRPDFTVLQLQINLKDIYI